MPCRFARWLEHVEEIDIDTLGGLRAKIDNGRFILHRAHESLEHEIEHARLSKFAAAIGTDFAVNSIGAEAMFAFLAVDHRIGESGDMAGGLPDFGMHEDGGIEALDIVAAMSHCLPPESFDIIFHLDTKRAVIPARAETTVDFG